MADHRKQLSRVLTDLRHGGHAVAGGAPPAAAADLTADAVALEAVVQDSDEVCLDDRTTPFDYLFTDLKSAYPAKHLAADPASDVVAALKALGSAMVDAPPDAEPNSPIPPVYTYWGQFVDHDITANTDREESVTILDDPLTPLKPGFVTALVRNLREPALNLDSVYGTGPGDPVVPYTGAKLDIGPLQVLTGAPFAHVPGADLPRRTADGKARIGDSRNDENLIVAQLHLAFLQFHNKVVEWLETNEPDCDDDTRFARARELTRWHYQWIVVEDFLRTVAMSSVVDDLLTNPVADKVKRPLPDGTTEVFMPLEHSVAAYRFGHSMVRARYDHNENFGRLEDGTEPPLFPPNRRPPQRADFSELFDFTGGGIIKGDEATPGEFEFTSLPDNWPIRWKRFTDPQSLFTDRFARKIDTHLAPPLKNLTNEGNSGDTSAEGVRITRILKRLAVRNLLRGYRLAIPTGQAVAQALGVTPLTEDQLLGTDPGVQDALVDGNFVDATPLWFYVLREAEATQGGERLGEVGSRIVCTTLIGQIQADPDSYLNRTGGAWSPAEGVKLQGGGEVKSIKSFLEFADVLI